MPVFALAALIVAFCVSPGEVSPWSASGQPALQWSLAALGTSVYTFVVALLGWGLTRWAVRVGGGPGPRKWAGRAFRLVDLLALAAYAFLILVVDWADLVGRLPGVRSLPLADDVLIYLPFPLLQCFGWRSIYPAEVAFRAWRSIGFPPRGPNRSLLLRLRQQYGILAPVACCFGLAQDATAWLDPRGDYAPWPQLAGYGVIAFVIVTLSPALIRLTWPTTTLPAGPLRDRLEGLSERLDFRFTDILLWETGGSVINAGVTGALPWFRYVLLTDALVANLEPRQVEAVFGHEVGHVAHRHLTYFATFFLGSFGVMALVVFGIDRSLSIDGPLWLGPKSPWLEWVLQSGAALGLVVGYFAVVFGLLSRRLERQADVFGCRSVSCGRVMCPPHLDVNVAPDRAGDATGVCPVGVRIFIEALTAVAALNGIDPASRSWRHGSISGRIAFLERLELRPETERAFQRQIATFRVSLVTLLGLAVAVAYWIGALAEL